MNDLIKTKELESGQLKNLVNSAFGYAESSIAINTKRTFSCAWESFSNWCSEYKIDPIKTESKEAAIALYVTDMASKQKLKRASIECYFSGICFEYLRRGIAINVKDHALMAVMKGVRKSLSKKPTRKTPLLTENIRDMVQEISSERLLDVRDRAILLVGFAGAFRRSELVTVEFDDVKFSRDGVTILVRRSKTDQEGAGLDKAIPYGSNPTTCPVRALQNWMSRLNDMGICSGKIFRSITRHGKVGDRLTPHAVALIVKRNPKITSNQTEYSGHSLRAGFVTSAAKRCVPEDLIMRQTGHRSSNTVKTYIRRGRAFEENAAGMVGL